MEAITSIIFSLASVTYFFGQIGKFYFETSIGVLFIFNIVFHLKNKDFKIKNSPLMTFIIIAWATFFINLFQNSFPVFPGILYLVRLTALLSFFILPPPKPKHNLFILVIISNVVFGLIQYFLWPDFTYFKSLDWDPHLYRLVSTFFDPTFTGLIYLMFLIFVFLNFSKFPILVSSFLLLVTYLAMALTYSRSTFLSFVICFIFISVKLKKPRIGIIATILILLTITVLPRLEGEGTKLERTSSIKAKIENYQEGFSLFCSHPIIGVGYNNLFYTRHIINPTSHANSGFDGSLMTVLTTTGILGLVPFCLGFYKLFKRSTLITQSAILAIFVHSLFANSLLYPWTIMFLVLI